MAYINQPPDLRVLFSDLERRLRLLETATRFTFPAVASPPSNPRIGDAWLDLAMGTANIVDQNGIVRTFTIT
jgi:hypothetical protein